MALSRTEQIGQLYIWGKDDTGQLGLYSRANGKLDSMDDDLVVYYPRLQTKLKDKLIVNVSCG